MLKYVCDRCGQDIESLCPTTYSLPFRDFTLVSVNGQIVDKLPTNILKKKEMHLCCNCLHKLVKFLEDSNDEEEI